MPANHLHLLLIMLLFVLDVEMLDAMDDHLAMIKQKNDHIAKLTAKITEHEL